MQWRRIPGSYNNADGSLATQIPFYPKRSESDGSERAIAKANRSASGAGKGRTHKGRIQIRRTSALMYTLATMLFFGVESYINDEKEGSYR